MSSKPVSRRSFLEKSTVAMVSAPMVVSPSVFGANETVIMGIIGAGGRGRGVMQSLIRQGAKFAAVCDPFKPNLEQGLARAEENAKGYKDYRELLGQKDIDAVLIGTPEHQHGVQLIDSVNAGKDAYCEKPMSHSIEEGTKMVKAVRATKQIVQIGMQRRSSEAVRSAKKVIDDGLLGKIFMVKAWWNWNYARPLDNSPLNGELDWDLFCYPRMKVPYEPMKYRYWRYFWPFSGGNVTDQGTHLMDVVQWFMGSGTPLAAECFGSVYAATGSETPDVFSATFDYGSFLATWSLNYTNRFEDGWNIQFQGDNGTMMIDERGVRVYGDRWSPDIKPDQVIEGGIPTEPHTQNFLDCVKSRNEPNAPVEVGHAAVSGPHLANVAWHKKERAYLTMEGTTVY